MARRNIHKINPFCERNPAFTPGAVRWHIFNAKQNGLEKSGAILRIGRAVYIDEDLWFDWIDGQQLVGVQ